MSFDGRDYHHSFEEACKKLPYVRDSDEVRAELEGIEWQLWEAVRGVFFYGTVLTAGLIVLPIAYALDSPKSFVGGMIAFVAIALLATALYWLFRFIFWEQISRHVTGRKFGNGGLD